MPAGLVGLVPLPVFDGDLSALDLNGSHADAGPEDEDVDLVFCPPVPQLDGVGEDDVVREAVLQRVPDRFLGHLAVAKFGFFRNAFHRCSINSDFG